MLISLHNHFGLSATADRFPILSRLNNNLDAWRGFASEYGSRTGEWR